MTLSECLHFCWPIHINGSWGWKYISGSSAHSAKMHLCTLGRLKSWDVIHVKRDLFLWYLEGQVMLLGMYFSVFLIRLCHSYKALSIFYGLVLHLNSHKSVLLISDLIIFISSIFHLACPITSVKEIGWEHIGGSMSISLSGKVNLTVIL